MSHTLDKGRAGSRGRRARNRLRTAAAVAAAVGAALSAPLGAHAQPLVPTQESGRGPALAGGESRTVVAQRGPVSLAQAQTLALARFPGRVAGAKTIEVNGRSVHEIRIVGEDNLVRTFRIDAQSGAFL